MKLATIKEVAVFLRMKESTLYSWVGSGLIPSFKINGLIRFDMEEIEAWLRDSRKQPSGAKGRAYKPLGSHSIEKIIKKAIADTKETRYNLPSGKPG